MKSHCSFPEQSCLIGVALAGLASGVLLISSFIRCGPIGETSLLCTLVGGATRSRVVANYSPTSTQLEAIIH